MDTDRMSKIAKKLVSGNSELERAIEESTWVQTLEALADNIESFVDYEGLDEQGKKYAEQCFKKVKAVAREVGALESKIVY